MGGYPRRRSFGSSPGTRDEPLKASACVEGYLAGLAAVLTTTRKRFSQKSREPMSFWRENVIAIVILVGMS